MTAYREKLQSLGFSRPSARQPKTTVDVHDTHTVEVTEHWHDRQDVLVKPQPVKLKPKGTVHG
ncbi:MAG: hypothetical protein LC798_05445 [Chloroflexi bacterium]|nr:hypothetical protein [Chloroflexota bacterium]